ncbi:hypothetical protein COW49_02630 [Candidatus Kaiserbacteria bacterium CG17_big_fil_post_rev_8_21_14_2_50_51_7]|uniref:Uncharacterized protein n=1 Tax=Candidatus Kaiserbacteria bacterium CG17_big_fil_post_rev_8_21_14_2_50_51_7 TaxID=1974613 RepID=A0A2M7FC25_9BACT|nr:MAG: hypothetical protein COW49_02630 [Candidatus Kaiserbacteria bacterium CG17_big_fil_post_rev_8_21_14_2_50_51_7]
MSESPIFAVRLAYPLENGGKPSILATCNGTTIRVADVINRTAAELMFDVLSNEISSKEAIMEGWSKAIEVATLVEASKL